MLKNTETGSLSFDFNSIDELHAAIGQLHLDLSLAVSHTRLFESFKIADLKLPNRLCVQPLEGNDADINGAPGDLTLRRYRRYAEGGFGTLWIEAVAIEPKLRSAPRQLCLTRANAAAFSAFAHTLRECARARWNHELCLIIQLAHPGRYCASAKPAQPVFADAPQDTERAISPAAPASLISDDQLELLQQSFIQAAGLALELGFDGVDIKACYDDLPADLLRAVNRPGRFGGSLNNRSRLLREVIAGIKAHHPDALIASRLNVRIDNPAETMELIRSLHSAGAVLINAVPQIATVEDASTEYAALRTLDQSARLTKQLRAALPDIAFVLGGLSRFRHLLPPLAAGLVESGAADLIGVGRAALAYPDMVADLVNNDTLHPECCCLNCDACTQLLKDGGRAGCVLMDNAIYAAEYRAHRSIATDYLKSEAERCRMCVPAPCRQGCPADIDVSGFIRAFLKDDITAAYETLRRSNVLPAMCAQLCPVNALCEGACVAGILDGKSIPIHTIQYVICREAAAAGIIGVRLPQETSGWSVGVVGAGPAGTACAAELLERGHRVVIYERSTRMGGTPELLISPSRFSGAAAEVEALLKPALLQGRLVVKYGCELGDNLSLSELQNNHDALFLATGLWGEKRLGILPGVIPGVDFLLQARSGRIRTVPHRVVLLAGGDSAMDCARFCMALGCRELLIVFADPLAQMHWHMPDAWFRTPGVHFLTMTRPLEYLADDAGALCAIQVRNRVLRQSAAECQPEEIIETQLVVEAMGLQIEDSARHALASLQFTETGLLSNVAADSFSCGMPGVFAGGALINGGDSVVRCVAEGRDAALEIDNYLRRVGIKPENKALLKNYSTIKKNPPKTASGTPYASIRFPTFSFRGSYQKS